MPRVSTTVAHVASAPSQLGMTRAAAFDLARYKIRVNGIAPGLVDTDQQSDGMTEEEIAVAGERALLGRITTPEDIADTALFLCSDEWRFATGQTVHVSGSRMLFRAPLLTGDECGQDEQRLIVSGRCLAAFLTSAFDSETTSEVLGRSKPNTRWTDIRASHERSGLSLRRPFLRR